MMKVLIVIGCILLYFVIGSLVYALAKVMGVTHHRDNRRWTSYRNNWYACYTTVPRLYNTLLLLFFPFTIALCIATVCKRVVDTIFDKAEGKRFIKEYCDVTKDEYEEWHEYGYSKSYEERHHFSIITNDQIDVENRAMLHYYESMF